ncbi:hypothetical protein [Nitrospirillum sp. BR 11163]|uniref:hypothetical protein n=1 Tax=Nitrospirillum sp. BR 11163 TaxID=3104323 RepID=UPI002AFED294|nr:hypothetical protein [Nitrospirillum sp. BR 11163]MEA1677283.1 hypothetical protein [Nitrospirillum sp. BR 11163]
MPDSFSSHAPFAAAPGQAMRGWVEAAIPEGRLLIGPTLAVPAGMRRYAITVPFRPWQDNRVIQALNGLDEFGRQRLRLVVDGVDHRCGTGQLMGRVMADFANGSLSAYLIPHATPPISPPTTPPPHPGGYGQQDGDPPGQPAQWSMIERVVGMLRRSIPYLPRDMQQAARSLFTLETLYWLAGFLAAWAVGHAAGYGEAIDVVLLGVGYAMVGWSVFGGLNDLGHGVAMAATAKTEHDLDEAAKRTAAGLTVLTINALIALIAKVKPASGGKRPPVVEEEPPPPPPDPPVKPVEPPPEPPKAKLTAGSDTHKAQRWQEYQDNGGTWNYDRWSNVYDANMTRASAANAAVDAYHKTLGWGEREVTVPSVVDGVEYPRRLDIADVAAQRGIEYKTGYQTATQDNLWEVARDKSLADEGWDIQWVFRDKASQPLKDALTDAGIKYTGGN